MEGTTTTAAAAAAAGAAAAGVWMTVSYEAKAGERAGCGAAGSSRGRAGNGNVAPSGVAAADVALGASGRP